MGPTVFQRVSRSSRWGPFRCLCRFPLGLPTVVEPVSCPVGRPNLVIDFQSEPLSLLALWVCISSVVHVGRRVVFSVRPFVVS